MTTVRLSETMGFNDTAAMDLHQLGQRLQYLKVTDEFSRFQNATTIKSKDSHKDVSKTQDYSIGSPKNVFSDNGGVFVSTDFTDFCENFNIKVKTTAVEAPRSNGISESHNAILTDHIVKVKEDINCNCFDWAHIKLQNRGQWFHSTSSSFRTEHKFAINL